MFEVRSGGIWRFVRAPFVGIHVAVTVLSVILLAASDWFWLVAAIWLGWIEWRASRLWLRADASGITVVNYFRRYDIHWKDVRGVWAVESGEYPATVSIARSKGRLWSVDAHVTAGLRKVRRPEVALRVAELGRSFGYGFPTGSGDDLDALRRAGLWDVTDPEAHQAYWDAHEPLV